MHLREQAERLAERLPKLLPGLGAPVVFIQLGSGFDASGLLDRELCRAPFSELPGMPSDASAAGHRLELVLGEIGGRQALVAVGRRHLYEGLGVAPCVLPMCAAVLAGVDAVVLLAACGSVNPEFSPGTVVALTDFINNLGTSPLVGPRPLGESYFVEMHEPFSHSMISGFLNTAAAEGVTVRLGVYQANLGPQFETPAEVEVARRNGADLVGMSTVPETIAARALGTSVLGLGLVTNQATTNAGKAVSHAEVTEVSQARSPVIMRALNRWICEA